MREGTTRRTFLAGAATATAASGLHLSMASAQTPSPALAGKPAADFSRSKVTQICMVVRDAQRVAKHFSAVFGPSWRFYDFSPTNLTIANRASSQASCQLKLAVGNLGGYSFKLVQPVAGDSAYAQALEKYGEGFYSVVLATPFGVDQSLAGLKAAGVGIEMQGDIGDGSTFTVLDTSADLGLRIELIGAPKTAKADQLRQTGLYRAVAAPIIDMQRPVLEGGRRLNHIGICVDDEKRVAQRYQQLLGISDWHFLRIPVLEYKLFGKALTEAELPSAETGQGSAYIGDTQLELLGVVMSEPGGIHQHFYKKHGNAFQHMAIGPSAGDYEAEVAALNKAGFQWEIQARISLGPRTVNGNYVSMEEQLGGFVLEFNG